MQIVLTPRVYTSCEYYEVNGGLKGESFINVVNGEENQ